MARKLIIICGNHWAPRQTRSNRRVVLDNAQLLSRWLDEESSGDNQQLLHVDSAHLNNGRLNFLKRCLSCFTTRKDIFEAYQFLAKNYQNGDDIYLFGAGRGGYVVRKLAMLVDQLGLRDVSNSGELRKTLSARLSSNSTAEGEAVNNGPVRNAKIKLLGCWDSTGHKGLPIAGFRKISSLFTGFEDCALPGNVEMACQALALDESKASHDPAIWTSPVAPLENRIRQVWFAGSHQNVTGGLANTQLSDIPLMWMISQAKKQGLAFDDDQILLETNADAFGKITTPSRLGSRLINRFLTASRPIGMANTHFNRLGMKDTEKLHSSVQQRIDSQYVNYAPKALGNMMTGELGIEQENMDMYENARRHARQPVDLPATLISDNGKINCSVLDLSKGGAKIWFSGQLKVGTSLVLHTPKVISDVKGKIVWHQDNMFGLQFNQPTDLRLSA
jgi:type VI secretion system (T6SS) phospholipase Tle1-like effector/PilZ domain-containing protein